MATIGHDDEDDDEDDLGDEEEPVDQRGERDADELGIVGRQMNRVAFPRHLPVKETGMKGTPYIDSPPPPEPNYRNGSTTAREVELISRIAQGDRKAFEELYGLYHRRLARFLTRLTKRYDVAEEVINDTFYIVWRKAGISGGSR